LRHPFAQRVRVEPAGDPALAKPRGAAQRPLPIAAGPERDVRRLHGMGKGADVAELHVLADVAGWPGVEPRLFQRADIVVRHRTALAELFGREAQRTELRLQPARTDAADDAAAGETV